MMMVMIEIRFSVPGMLNDAISRSRLIPFSGRSNLEGSLLLNTMAIPHLMLPSVCRWNGLVKLKPVSTIQAL
jgi:hypothetical protein